MFQSESRIIALEKLKYVMFLTKCVFSSQSFTPWAEDWIRGRVSLHQRWTQNDLRTGSEILQEVTQRERCQKCHWGTLSNLAKFFICFLYALQQTISFCFSAGHGLKSARVIQSVSRRVSFSIGARLYKLWNNHDSQAGRFYVTVCIMKYGVILIVYTHFVLLGDSVQHVENWV